MSSAPIPGRFVLVVDDVEIIARATSRALARYRGLASVSLTDGRVALAYCRSRCPIIALLDVHMPAMDGVTVACRLRHHHPDLPILFVTACPAAIDFRRVSAGSTAFVGSIAKPCSTRELLAAVDAALVGSPTP